MSEATVRPVPFPARKPGCTLERDFYTDAAIFGADLERIFYNGWLFAGHSCELGKPGDYLVFSVGTESLLLTRDESGELHAHHNVCAHRGSRIVLSPRGNARALVCPYHQWVYGMNGKLRSARLMGDCFDTADHQLRPAAVRELSGLLFVSLSDSPPSFDPMVAAIEPQLRPHGIDRAKIVRRDRYTVQANWKTIVENNRECYHCRGSHPQFCLSNFDFGTHGDIRTNESFERRLAESYGQWLQLGLSPRDVAFPDGLWFRVARLPLKDGFRTESVSGELVAPLMGSITQPETGSLRIVSLPNMWAHANCDYAMTTRLTPVAPGVTDVEVCFLVDADARAGTDYESAELSEVWRATSEQDWELCENNYAGIASRGYRPGPYSTVVENSVDAFLTWYLACLG